MVGFIFRFFFFISIVVLGLSFRGGSMGLRAERFALAGFFFGLGLIYFARSTYSIPIGLVASLSFVLTMLLGLVYWRISRLAPSAGEKLMMHREIAALKQRVHEKE